MSLLRKISNEIDKTVFQFFEHLSEMDSERYNPEEMVSKWKDFMKNNKSSAHGSKLTKDGRPRKVSAYINFCKEKRDELRSNGLSFGEVSKELGRQWRELSKEEKNRYLSNDEEVTTKSSPPRLLKKKKSSSPVKKTKTSKKKTVSSAKTTPEEEEPTSVVSTPEKKAVKPKKTDDDDSSVDGSESVSPIDFNKLLMPQLKKLCKEKGMDIKKKNRAELIEMLTKTGANDEEDDEEDYSNLLDEEEEETMLG